MLVGGEIVGDYCETGDSNTNMSCWETQDIYICVSGWETETLSQLQ